MKFLRKSFVDEGDDWFRAIGKAYLFAKEQLKRGNPYAAVMVEASLVEQSVRLLLALHLVSTTKMEDEAAVAKMEKQLEVVRKGQLFRNTDRLIEANLVPKRLRPTLRKFREARNEVTHLAFTGITNHKAREFVGAGTKIMGVLGNKIALLIGRLDEGIADDNPPGVRRAAILALMATNVNEAKALREWKRS